MAKRSIKSDPKTFDSSELSKSIGIRVRELRLKAGLTQQQLAEKFETQQSQVFEIETGGANVTIRTLARLADVFQTDVADFFPVGRSRPLSQPSLELLHRLLTKLSIQLDERRVLEERRLAHEADLVSELRVLSDLRIMLEKAFVLPHKGKTVAGDVPAVGRRSSADKGRED